MELLIAWSREYFLRNSLVPRLVEKFPAFYRTQNCIGVFTRACHWALSWTMLMQSTHSLQIILETTLIFSSDPLVDLRRYPRLSGFIQRMPVHYNERKWLQILPHGPSSGGKARPSQSVLTNRGRTSQTFPLLATFRNSVYFVSLHCTGL
jgi:hypothetical protein